MNDSQTEPRHTTDCVLVERTCDFGHALIKFYDQVFHHDTVSSTDLHAVQAECPVCSLRREIAESVADVVVRVNTLEKACAEQISKWREDERQTREAQAMLVAPEDDEK